MITVYSFFESSFNNFNNVSYEHNCKTGLLEMPRISLKVRYCNLCISSQMLHFNECVIEEIEQ